MQCDYQILVLDSLQFLSWVEKKLQYEKYLNKGNATPIKS